MWRACAVLCLTTGVVGGVFADASPRIREVQVEGGPYASTTVYLGICDGKKVESYWAFRDCDELKRGKVFKARCGTGVSKEDRSEQALLQVQAQAQEQERIRNRPVLHVVRDALSPLSRE